MLLGALYPWVLIVILAIVVMVFLHELGHYMTAKRAGMKVTEFFIGFGPKLWSFQRGETEYGLKLIPAGAYVKIIGMHNLEEVAPEDEGRTYRQKSLRQPASRWPSPARPCTSSWRSCSIFLALVAVGQPGGTLNPKGQETKWSVGSVVKGSGAADAGLRKGDKVVTVAGQPISEFTDLKSVVQKHKGEIVPVTVLRGGGAPDPQRRAALVHRTRTTGTTGCCLGIGPAYPGGAAVADRWAGEARRASSSRSRRCRSVPLAGSSPRAASPTTPAR